MFKPLLAPALGAALLLGAGPACGQSTGQPLPSQNTTTPYPRPQPAPAQPSLSPLPGEDAGPSLPGRTPALDEALGLAEVDPGPIGEVSEALPAPQFVAMAGSSGLFEIASSQLALQRTQDQGLRAFAQRMIDDHNAANQALRMAVSKVREVGLNRVGGLEPRHQQWLNTLQQASGEEFDRLYIFYQTLGHKEAVELFQNYAWNGDNDRLREFAVSWTPMLRQHHAMAMTLSGADRLS